MFSLFSGMLSPARLVSKVRKVLGAVAVHQGDTVISITGISADSLLKDIFNQWNTSKIQGHMFSSFSGDHIEFPLFFATDIVFIIDTLLASDEYVASRRSLAHIREKLLTETWLKDTDKEIVKRVDLSRIDNLIYRPLDYQNDFIQGYDLRTQRYHLRGHLLAAAAGSGKTFITLALAECLDADRIIVICPKHAIDRVWVAEVLKLFKKPQTFWVASREKPFNDERVAIMHYEWLGKALEIVNKLKGKRTVVILDESHNLNEAKSLRTQNYLDLVEKLDSHDVIWASGTAIKALGAEAIPLLRAIDPFFTEDVEKRFRKIFGQDGSRGLDILQHRMGNISYKVEKHQLGLDKPVIMKIPVTVPDGRLYTLEAIRVDMVNFVNERVEYYKARREDDQSFYDICLNEYEFKLYNKQKDLEEFRSYKSQVKVIQYYDGDGRMCAEEMKFCNIFEKTKIIPMISEARRKRFIDVKSVIKYTKLKIQGEALGRILGRKRIECHVAMVPHINYKSICGSTTKKTVIFTSFVEVLEVLSNHLVAQGMSPMVVYAKTNSELAKTVGAFETDIDVNPLIATFQSLSTAVPLVMADTMILMNSPFRAYIHEQAISRIHRLGADTQTTIYEAYLDTGTKPNISTRSSDILKWSQEQVAAIMGIPTAFDVVDDFSTVTVSNESYGITEVVDMHALAKQLYKAKETNNCFSEW